MKMILTILLVSSMSLGSAYAQSAHRADEKINNPDIYRLGDSADLQADQLIIDHLKVEQQKQRQDLNNPGQMKRLLKHHDMI